MSEKKWLITYWKARWHIWRAGVHHYNAKRASGQASRLISESVKESAKAEESMDRARVLIYRMNGEVS